MGPHNPPPPQVDGQFTIISSLPHFSTAASLQQYADAIAQYRKLWITARSQPPSLPPCCWYRLQNFRFSLSSSTSCKAPRVECTHTRPIGCICKFCHFLNCAYQNDFNLLQIWIPTVHILVFVTVTHFVLKFNILSTSTAPGNQPTIQFEPNWTVFYSCGTYIVFLWPQEKIFAWIIANPALNPLR